VALLTPQGNALLSGTTTISANATDNIGVVGVQFLLNGTNLGAEDTTNSYAIPWNTTTVPDGTYTLTATARDAAGNSMTSASVTVTVSNLSGPPSDTTPPSVTLTAPVQGSTLSGAVTLTASATDNSAIVGVQFHLNSVNLGPEDTTNTYGVTWDTTTVPDDTYVLTATARDAAGHTTTSSPITVTVTNTSTLPPSPSSLTLSNLTVASGQAYAVPTAGLQVGSQVFIDRTYTFTTVPASLQGAAYIQTANNDKTATNAAFLSFDVNQPVTVYVAHNVRATPKPAWLTNFTDTGEDLGTSASTLHLFAQTFAAGTVTLGGNGNRYSMYSVVVVPQGGSGLP
jgi:predicted secreted protein